MLDTEPKGSAVPASREGRDFCCRTGLEDNGPGEEASRWFTVAVTSALPLPENNCAAGGWEVGAVAVAPVEPALALASAVDRALAVADSGLDCAVEEEET
jgi:hypothetical protein